MERPCPINAEQRPEPANATGRCLIFIFPDNQRFFSVAILSNGSSALKT